MKTCCQTSEVHLTPGDVGRIAAYTARQGFYEYRAPQKAVYEHAEDDDPVWRENVFRPDGTRRVLKREEDGNCIFLGERGCVLPLEVRPLVCRIYPFDYDQNGVKERELSPGCPLELLRPGADLVAELAMNRADADRWQAQLYQEIRLNHNSSVDADIDQRETEPAQATQGEPAGGVSCASA